jgi:hypothetical protein
VLGVAVGVCVFTGVVLGVAVAVLVPHCVGVAVGVCVFTGVVLGVAVAVGVCVLVSVALGVAVGVCVFVGVAVGVSAGADIVIDPLVKFVGILVERSGSVKTVSSAPALFSRVRAATPGASALNVSVETSTPFALTAEDAPTDSETTPVCVSEGSTFTKPRFQVVVLFAPLTKLSRAVSNWRKTPPPPTLSAFVSSLIATITF